MPDSARLIRPQDGVAPQPALGAMPEGSGVVRGDAAGSASTNREEAAPQSRVKLGHSAEYQEFVDGQFMALALREGLSRLRGLSWPTDFTDIGSLGDVVCSAAYDFTGAHCVLARFPAAVAMLVIQRSRFVARLAAASEEALDQTEALLREAVPQAEPAPDRQEAVIAFWHGQRGGGVPTYTRLPVPAWSEITANYGDTTRTGLDEMMSGFRPGHGGRLILWSGPPGTGKTYALRALAWEWRSWCSVHYIADPEVMFGANGQHLMEVVMQPQRPGQWRLIVLEDTGELLAADAKNRTGQALSRLLNVVDGLIGQGFPSLVLVTTNEELRALHPAIARPGRCATRIEFEPLSQQEADAWLADRDCEVDAEGTRTLAELYAVAEDFAVLEQPGQTVGFVR